jgi:hypothetical protein
MSEEDSELRGLIARGLIGALLGASLLHLGIEIADDTPVAGLVSSILFVYITVVLSVGVFGGRPFAPRVQLALFAGLTAYWAYDFLERDSTLSILLVAAGLLVLVQQGRRAIGRSQSTSERATGSGAENRDE